jgi:predicted dehydrogenase
MPPIAELIRQQKNVTGGIKMLSIREHRFPFLPKVDNWNRFNKNSGGTFVEKCCHFFDLMRLITKSNPIKIMASGGQAVNHLKENYAGLVPDIWDHGYVIVEFENNIKAMLELCMFAEGSKYQEEISITGGAGKVEAFIPGPARFWPKKLGPPPISKIVVSPRDKSVLKELEVPVDKKILEAGDHNGSTFYQHQKFMLVVDGKMPPEVTLDDGIWAVRMGHAAQTSAETGQVVNF